MEARQKLEPGAKSAQPRRGKIGGLPATLPPSPCETVYFGAVHFYKRHAINKLRIYRAAKHLKNSLEIQRNSAIIRLNFLPGPATIGTNCRQLPASMLRRKQAHRHIAGTSFSAANRVQ